MFKKNKFFFKLLDKKKGSFYKLVSLYSLSSIIDILILAVVSILSTYLIGGSIEAIDKRLSPYVSNSTNISLILGMILILIYLFRTIFSYIVLKKIIEFSASNLKFLRNKIFNI
jgi:heme/copper-type cytochrome/quinol oxidase subunit 2